MSSGCSQLDFLRGGFIAEAQISSSNIQGSVISGSELTASSVTNLTGIDEASIKKIVDGIAQLPEEHLAILAQAIQKAMPNAAPSTAPVETVADDLPTTVLGRRDKLLGEPTGWLELSGLVVPAYEVKECQ